MNKLIEIIESKINGNVSFVKSEVKKLSKAKRKDLYVLCTEIAPNEARFFWELI